MLNKRENEVMRAVYSLAHEKGICLISPSEFLSLLPPRKKYTEAQIERILNELALDNYFELLSSERKGEKMYVITLTNLGLSFLREHHNKRRNVALKLGWSILSAVIAFLVGLLLKKIF